MSDRPATPDPAPRSALVAGALAGAVVVRLWVMPLESSLWLDEFGTAWVTAGSFREIVTRARLFPQSVPYAAIVWTLRALFGASEIVLRLPSLLAMLGAAYCLYRLGSELFDREAGLRAAGILLLFPQIEFAAADARPYALGVLAATASLWALVRWLGRGGVPAALAYVLLAAATVYFQYLFATMLVAHAIYALRVRARARASGRQMLGVAAGLGVLLAPAAAFTFEIGGRRWSHGLAGTPGWTLLVQALVPGRVLGVLLACFVLCFLLRVVSRLALPSVEESGRRDTLALLGMAALLPAPLLFAICRAAGSQAFTLRYLMAAIPAQALLLGWFLGGVEPPRGRWALLGGALAFALVRHGGVEGALAHGREDWRGAVGAVNAANGEGPVLLAGSFMESRDLALVGDPVHAAYLRAPLDFYASRGPVRVLPLRDGSAAESSVASVLAAAPRADRFALIERSSSFPSWEPWLEEKSRAAGYATRKIWASGALSAWAFERGSSGPAP